MDEDTDNGSDGGRRLGAPRGRRRRDHTRSGRHRHLQAPGRAAAALLLLAALGGCVSQPSVEVALVGLAPMESTLLEQRLRLDFRLQNFGDRVLEATGVELTLNVNGRRLARGVDNGAFRVDRLGETRVSAVVSTSLFDVARQLLELPDRDTFSYQLTGRIYLQGWPRSVGFNRGGEISRADLSRLVGSGGRAPQPLRLE